MMIYDSNYYLITNVSLGKFKDVSLHQLHFNIICAPLNAFGVMGFN